MSFYTADYIKSLVKEDHAYIKEFLEKRDSKGTIVNDFRSYIDATLPFSLYIDIGKLEEELINYNQDFFINLSEAANIDIELLVSTLMNAYRATINEYINDYPAISAKQLEDKLNSFSSAVSNNKDIKSTLSINFDKTYVIRELSKPNTSVLIISPSFKTIQSGFSKKVKDHFDYNVFSDERQNSLETDSARTIVRSVINGEFQKLQNLGHIDEDIISSSSSEVKRGIVTPRLLASIIDLPKSITPSQIARKFSKETGQASTRIIVRKKFYSTKLVLEMLIEHGFMIGKIEAPDENLLKAPLEAAFSVGKGLTARLRKNPEILSDLVTSKSLKNYIEDSLVDILKNKSISSYNSTSNINTTSPISINKVELNFSNNTPTNTTSKIRNVKNKELPSLTSLQALLSAGITKQVISNMGMGNRKDILNYRTGRFAESVTIDRLTQSKQGMISVFYNYMRNPYGTFSEGGRQESPKTRDPKLLISKSIREIGAKNAYNRMRAVLA